jgi:CBS-domain-containing membrane protein
MTTEPDEPGGGTPPTTMSKAEAARVLRRSGFSAAQIDELFSRLDDPIDVDRDGALLQLHGITRGHLIDDMGGSP